MNPVEARFKYLFWLSRLRLGQPVTVEIFNRDLTIPTPGAQYPGSVVYEFIDSDAAIVEFEFKGAPSNFEFVRLAVDTYECGIGPYVGYHPSPLFVVLPPGTRAIHSTWHPWYFWPEGDYDIP